MGCAVASDAANPPDPYLLAAEQMDDDRIVAFDASPYTCAGGQCYAVVGGTAVYYDADHLNLDFARRFAPMLSALLPRAGVDD